MGWAIPKVEGIKPVPRGGHACVGWGTKVLMFGGSDRAPVTYDDLWMLETAGGTYEWTRISPSFSPGCKVYPRSGASLTVVGDQVYLFGGQEPLTEVRFNDVKVLDTKTWEWSNVDVAQGGSPPPRHSHVAGCLAEKCLLLYGGSGYQGPLSDVWVFNCEQRTWSRPAVTGQHPSAREMHAGCMVDDHTLLVFGGRSGDGRILCDAAVLDCTTFKWVNVEPTPFSRCAHSCVAISTPDDQAGTSSSGRPVLIYGGFNGEVVEGDVLKLDSKTLEIELLRRGPRESDKAGTVPPARFAHNAATVSAPGEGGGKEVMIIFGGVNPQEDLCDIGVWSMS